MSLSQRENYLRNATMTGPEWMPVTVVISDATWDQLREDLEEVVVRHPKLFPDFQPGWRNYDNYQFTPAHRAGERFTDSWGCVWESAIDGIEGVVVENPLADWEALADYQPPDPLLEADRGPAYWPEIRQGINAARERGELTTGSLAHGFLFMRLCYLRGFENLMIDIATQDPRLQHLIDMVVEHNYQIVQQWLQMQVDVVMFGEDLGTQTASIISPADFHAWITPSYKKLMHPCCQADALVYLHSDGYIMDLMDEFVECGIDIINPQDLCNGIDNLAAEIKGRMCICLDIDRQKIVPYGTRQEIRDLIEEEVRKLGSPQGGLEMIVGIYPPTPAQNVDALCEALEDYQTYWWDGRGG